MTASTEQSSRASPLAGWAARFAAASDSPDAFSIHEIPFATQINFRGPAHDPAFGERVRTVLSCGLPAKTNTWRGDAEAEVLWLGPDEWLAIAPEGRNEELVAALRRALAGTHHSVVDLSANRTIIEISGANARLVLAKGCPLDLHAGSFGTWQCAQSLLAKSQVLLQCVDAQPTLRLFVRISFANYVAEWLLDAAAELAATRKAGMLGLRL